MTLGNVKCTIVKTEFRNPQHGCVPGGVTSKWFKMTSRSWAQLSTWQIWSHQIILKYLPPHHQISGRYPSAHRHWCSLEYCPQRESVLPKRWKTQETYNTTNVSNLWIAIKQVHNLPLSAFPTQIPVLMLLTNRPIGTTHFYITHVTPANTSLPEGQCHQQGTLYGHLTGQPECLFLHLGSLYWYNIRHLSMQSVPFTPHRCYIYLTLTINWRKLQLVAKQHQTLCLKTRFLATFFSKHIHKMFNL